jgi:hypothetical protein
MLPYRESRLTKVIIGIFFLIVIIYAYFEARGLLFGPTIDISSDEHAVVDMPYILIQGQATHIASLLVDGEPIQVTQDGMFKEPYVLAPGANRIVFDAKDKYGHTTEKVVEIVYRPSATSSLQTRIQPAASSSTSIVSTTTPAAIIPIGTTTPSPNSSGAINPAVAPGR